MFRQTTGMIGTSEPGVWASVALSSFMNQAVPILVILLLLHFRKGAALWVYLYASLSLVLVFIAAALPATQANALAGKMVISVAASAFVLLPTATMYYLCKRGELGKLW